jgi:hypothetical protein
MARPRKTAQADSTQSHSNAARPRMTGIALTTEASRDSGFTNYRICILFIVDGEVVHVEKSQEYALFETIARFEILMERAHWNLSNTYRDGMLMSLGGDDRDRIINRLKVESPDVLKRIAPALGITA